MDKRKRQRGQSLVEVALAMPLLLLIMAGLLDLGRAYFTFVSISDAAEEGAAYAAFYPDDHSLIRERAAQASSGLIDLDTSMVSVAGGTTSGSPITVTVTFDLELLTPIFREFVDDNTLTMRATAVQAIIIGD